MHDCRRLAVSGAPDAALDSFSRILKECPIRCEIVNVDTLPAYTNFDASLLVFSGRVKGMFLCVARLKKVAQ